MADNITLPGYDKDVATDEIGSRHYQLIKPAFGVDGEATLVSEATPMPVVDGVSAEAQQDMIVLLTRMLTYMNSPQGYDKSLQRARVTAVLEGGTTNVGTMSTLSNQVALGGVQAQILPNAANLSAWHACCRSRIT